MFASCIRRIQLEPTTSSIISKLRKQSINFDLLNAYKDVKGDLKVPSKYVVGSEEDNEKWPAEFIGRKIGQHVGTIRSGLRSGAFSVEDTKRLFDMGFIPDIFADKHRKILLAFQTYGEKYGNMLIPTHFKIGSSDTSWPEDCRGMSLGRILSKARCGSYGSISNELLALGVPLLKQNQKRDFSAYFNALKQYKLIHGHVKVPGSYVIKHFDNRYDSTLWGLTLGDWLGNVRCTGAYNEHKDALLELGVDYRVQTMRKVEFEHAFEALKAFKDIHGTCWVPRKFKVPLNDERYPKETWGMNLGLWLFKIRIYDSYAEHRQRLIDLGVSYEKRNKFGR